LDPIAVNPSLCPILNTYIDQAKKTQTFQNYMANTVAPLAQQVSQILNMNVTAEALGVTTNKTKQNKTNKSKQNKTKQNKIKQAKQNKTKQNKTKQTKQTNKQTNKHRELEIVLLHNFVTE